MRNALAATLALALALSACTGPARLGVGPARPSVAKVRPGMTAEQVQALAGKPLRQETPPQEPDRSYWYYDGGVVILRNGKVEFSYPEARPED